MKHLKLFESITEYENYINSESVILPNISFVTETNEIQYNPIKKNYMRFVAIEDTTIKLNAFDYTEYEYIEPTINLMVKKNDVGWVKWDFTPIFLAAGETLYLKGNNENGFSNSDLQEYVGICHSFGDPMRDGNESTGKFECQGNIMSLIYGDDFENKYALPCNWCFANLFYKCSALISSPELPATTITPGCYAYMFYDCTALTSAPVILPATTLAGFCYDDMFCYCESLTTAPELPATTLAEYCCNSMFCGCTLLATAPALPATTLAEGCYEDMFDYCESLTTTPELPATTLAEGCYCGMFWGCIALTTVSELPATTLAEFCYDNMFSECTALTTVPSILPATTLSEYCYRNMFYGCTSLTTTPKLSATTLVNYCYDSMFEGCTNLNNITMLATDISANSCLYNWVKGVSATGTFTKHKDMTSLESGSSGIPTNWTVIDYQ